MGVGVMTSMRLRLVFSFSFGDLLLLLVGCFPVCVCVACRIGFCSVFCHLSTFCTCCAGVWGGERGRGGDDVHATATCVFFFFW